VVPPAAEEEVVVTEEGALPEVEEAVPEEEELAPSEEETTPSAKEGKIALTEGLLEAAETELSNIQSAVVAMMVDNGLSTLHNPVTTATNDMTKFPDASGTYVLYGLVRGDQTINYVAVRYSNGTYIVDKYGTVTQVTTGYGPADVYHSRGVAYARKGELDKAIADFDKAIELDPNFEEAYCNRGVAYVQKGEVEKAISDLEKCIELSDDPELVEKVQELLDKLKQ